MYSTIEMPVMQRAAEVAAVHQERREVELVFSTGADVVRYDFLTGRRFVERLSLAKGHVRLDRLNSGAPLLNAHDAASLASIVGTVVEGSARVDGKQGVARVRFSKRADVEPVFQDVKDRIIRSVSVGYRVHRFEETPGRGEGLAVRLATDWEPFELSLVPIPADAGAQVRRERAPVNPCVVVPGRVGADLGLQRTLCRMLDELPQPPFAGLSTEDGDRCRRLWLAILRERD